MSGMIERVAKAIYDAEKPSHHGDFESSCRIPGNKDFHFKVAIAAIAAMREPTAEMLTFSSFKSADDLYRYQAMIDAALLVNEAKKDR